MLKLNKYRVLFILILELYQSALFVFGNYIQIFFYLIYFYHEFK